MSRLLRNEIGLADFLESYSGGGFGFELKENRCCKGVLTLYFDDIEEPEHGLKLMESSQAKRIIRFIREHSDVDTLLIHCFAGVSRSRAVGVFAAKLLNVPFPEEDQDFNAHVYATLMKVWRSENEDT
ncbi:MAG: hypothetical protein IJ071_02280 [Ruminococcus sp.]|nr:hypothetical protein [Ruminococcus sp.]